MVGQRAVAIAALSPAEVGAEDAVVVPPTPVAVEAAGEEVGAAGEEVGAAEEGVGAVGGGGLSAEDG